MKNRFTNSSREISLDKKILKDLLKLYKIIIRKPLFGRSLATALSAFDLKSKRNEKKIKTLQFQLGLKNY
ncbi:hypothetical protein BpHYR1_024770 [Brachionus plicatilis]|uniref:Uncharacterized protein n=1 Tax=Brachionus plicatilis TaxID=10195 RepID=A0A3M7SHP1_BRAPC|nr:hypothetical protein BpHYR1_024770 [Brachionus plicatilis]